jgi:hypothetical protein
MLDRLHLERTCPDPPAAWSRAWMGMHGEPFVVDLQGEHKEKADGSKNPMGTREPGGWRVW